MGTFNNKIEAEFNPPKQWILSRALSYQNEDMEESPLQAVGIKCPKSKITCSKGFKTDLASTPKILWNIIAPWDIARAAIIHDLLYLRIRQYRAKNPEDVLGIDKAKKAADNVFLMAMKDSSPAVPSWKINAAYYAVVTFGRWSIIPREGDDDQM
jgi:hypothetical protein